MSQSGKQGCRVGVGVRVELDFLGERSWSQESDFQICWSFWSENNTKNSGVGPFCWRGV